MEVADSPSKAPYQIYEAIAQQSDLRWDKLQHFVRSATSEYLEGEVATDLKQWAKEFIKDEVSSWWPGSQDEGWNDADMEANNRGQALGKQLRREHRTP